MGFSFQFKEEFHLAEIFFIKNFTKIKLIFNKYIKIILNTYPKKRKKNLKFNAFNFIIRFKFLKTYHKLLKFKFEIYQSSIIV